MIRTSKQMKDLIRNQAHSDSGKSQMLLRVYAMERFLERITLSDFRNSFILKGGMLIASMVGLDNRATLDIDTTIKCLPLSPESAVQIIADIITISLPYSMRFEIKGAETIMDEADYSGVRVSMNAYMESMRIPLKVDISTGDEITPSEVQYSYKLMFEDRRINLCAYNIETVLAEKLETVLSRGILNTRLRDFYDLHILSNSELPVDHRVLRAALLNTARRRDSSSQLSAYRATIANIYGSQVMRDLWANYQKKSSYAAGLDWKTVIRSILLLCDNALTPEHTPVL